MTDDPQTVAGDTGAGPDTSGYLNYLLTNRDFTAPAVASAIKSLAPKLEVELRVFPVVATASEPAARAFLEQIVWPEMRHAVASNGHSVGMSESDVALAEQLLDPASPYWVGADPDAFVVQPTLSWTGCAPS